MPNTLVHIGINGIFTRNILKNSDLLWIFIGCIIPDFPWIFRKIIFLVMPSINGYDLQIYNVIQASLFFCIILSFSFAALSNSFWKTFAILSIGSFLHLLVDPLQFKWANGVHLLAPFDWKLTNYGFFWPESILTYTLTIVGIIFFFYNFKNIKKHPVPLDFRFKNSFLSVFFLLIYFLLPFQFHDNILENDSHFINTLKNVDERVGKYVEMDRKEVHFDRNSQSYWIESFNHDFIELRGTDHIESSRISIRGKFISSNLINVEECKENIAFFRDGASYLGLLLILVSWGIAVRNKLHQ